jgi:hypothetical protein
MTDAFEIGFCINRAPALENAGRPASCHQQLSAEMAGY